MAAQITSDKLRIGHVVEVAIPQWVKQKYNYAGTTFIGEIVHANAQTISMRANCGGVLYQSAVLPRVGLTIKAVIKEPPSVNANLASLFAPKPQPAARPVAAAPKAPARPRGGRAVVRNGMIFLSLDYDPTKELFLLARNIPGGTYKGKPDYFWMFPATPNAARNIKATFERFAMDLADAEFQALLAEYDTIVSAQEIKTAVAEALAQPEGLVHSLWLHQLRCARFAEKFRGAGIFMDMGVGKTLTTIALMVIRGCKTVLVVCPKKAVTNVWGQELAEHCAVPFLYCGLADDKMTTVQKVERAREALAEGKARGVLTVVAISYATAIRPPFAPKYETYQKANGEEKDRRVDDGFIVGERFDMIVADEVHNLKSPQGATSKIFGEYGLSCKYRLGLTGTPLPHDPLDVFGIYRFLDPTIFGTNFSEFKRRYAHIQECQRQDGKTFDQVLGFKNLPELEEKMYSIAFRVTEDVLDLPPKIFKTAWGELDAEERRIYNAIKKDFQAEIADGLTVSASNILPRIMRLSQIASGFVMDETKAVHEFGSSRVKLLMSVLDDLKRDEPVVIFYRFDYDRERIVAELERRGYAVSEVYGGKDEVAEWRAGKTQIIVVQIQAGGEAINLTKCGDRACKYAIYYGRDYNWGKYKQTLKRIHRPGQKFPTIFINLMMDDTVDQDIEETLATRGDLVTSIKDRRSFEHIGSGATLAGARDNEAEDAEGDDAPDEPQEVSVALPAPKLSEVQSVAKQATDRVVARKERARAQYTQRPREPKQMTAEEAARILMGD